jgi:phosphomannomutase
VIPADLRARAEAWIADDPSTVDRAELQALLDAAGRADDSPPDAGARTALADLADRFAGTLQFGTAGLRGAIGAGPNRMNRAVVQAATAGLVRWLREHRPAAAEAGVVLGWDARHRSAQFAEQAAAVLTGAGIHVHLLPGRSPTPLLAFAIRQLSAGAGVMITASHNPPADNGYKLYLGDGAQIVPPVDEQIEAAIRSLGPLAAIPLGSADGPLVTRHGDEVAQAYLNAVLVASAGAPATPAGAGLRVVYTQLHGVAGRLMLRAIEGAGYPAPNVVAAQAEPDPDFPTVSFPNPEEPGALDLALADARRLGADLILASDPDGDRLAVAVPDPAAEGGWRRLTGDQVGALLGAFLLDATSGEAQPDERLVATTVVSSTMLSKIAAAAGVRYAETLTGFKWIVRAGDQRPGSRFVLGYEEALGYAVGDVVRDKDGIGAALALLGLAAAARAAGESLLDRWAALEAAHGVHTGEQLTLPTRDPGVIMTGLRANPPAALGGEPVRSVDDLGPGGDLPPSDVLIFRLTGARVVIRPSGTEPKLKAYLEVTEPAGPGGLASARQAAAARMAELRAAVQALLTAPAD